MLMIYDPFMITIVPDPLMNLLFTRLSTCRSVDFFNSLFILAIPHGDVLKHTFQDLFLLLFLANLLSENDNRRHIYPVLVPGYCLFTCSLCLLLLFVRRYALLLCIGWKIRGWLVVTSKAFVWIVWYGS